MRAPFSSSLLVPCLLVVALSWLCPLPGGGEEKLPKKEAQLAPPPDPALQSGRRQVDKTPEYYDAVADQDLQREDYPAACKTYDEALAAYPGHPRLLHNAAAARDQWAAKAQVRGLWEDALEICADSIARGMSPEHFTQRVTVVVQGGGREFIGQQDRAGLKAWLSQAYTRFPKLAELRPLTLSLYSQALDSLSLDDEDAYLMRGKVLLNDLQELQGTAAPDAKLVQNWYGPLLGKIKDRKDWERGVAVIQEVRVFLPQDKVLRYHELSLWNSWAKAYAQNGEWDLAAIAYEQALERFPGENLFLKNLEVCRKRAERAGSAH